MYKTKHQPIEQFCSLAPERVEESFYCSFLVWMIIIAADAVAVTVDVAQKGNSLSLEHFTKHPIMLVAFVCLLMGIPCSLPIRKNTFFCLNDIIILGWFSAFILSSSKLLQHRVTLPFYTLSFVTQMHRKQSHVFYNFFPYLNCLLLFIVYGFEFRQKHTPTTLSASTSQMTSAQRKHQVHHTNQSGNDDAGQHNTNCKYEF